MKYYDLSRTGEILKRRHPYKRFVSAVERYVGAVTISSDLNKAERALGSFKRLIAPVPPGVTERRTAEDEEILAALFTHALTHYVRATHHTPGRISVPSRRGIEFAERYSDEQRAMHSRLVKLRNEAVAHFGTNADDPAGYWNQQAAVLTVNDAGLGKMHCPTTYANFRQELVVGLDKAIEAAQHMVLDDLRSRTNAVLDELNTCLLDPEFAEIFEAHPFDPTAWFGDEKAANLFVAQVEGTGGAYFDVRRESR